MACRGWLYGGSALLVLVGVAGWASMGTAASASSLAGIRKIHVIVIVQEHRSFDSYFGTFPGAAGTWTFTGAVGS